MLNRCEFIGHLGKDPEPRTANGTKVVSLSIGVTRKWKDASGEKKEATEWVRCNVWGSSKGDGLAGVAEKYLKKGSKVYVAGRMETRKYEKDGIERYSTEINVQEMELLDSRVTAEATQAPAAAAAPSGYDDDTIPF